MVVAKENPNMYREEGPWQPFRGWISLKQMSENLELKLHKIYLKYLHQFLKMKLFDQL